MTVQAGIETVTDLEVLVGEFEELACEHSRHGKDAHWHEDQPASHYVQARCACTGEQWTNAYAACPRFVAQISPVRGFHRRTRRGVLSWLQASRRPDTLNGTLPEKI